MISFCVDLLLLTLSHLSWFSKADFIGEELPKLHWKNISPELIPIQFFFLISQVLNPKDGDELLSFLFMGTSCVQDLQHLSSLVTSFLGLGTHRALGSLRVCNERP